MSKETYSISEAATVAGVSETDIREAIRVGVLQAEKFQNTGDLFIHHKELMKFMRSSSKKAFSIEGVDQKRILIVDDELNFANIMKLQLERDKRFEVKVATSGKDALLLTRQFTPDLILLDFMLPDITGEKVLEAIRLQFPAASIKVIVYSAHTREAIKQYPELEARLIGLGAPEFVSKSIGTRPLIAKIFEALEIERNTEIRKKPTI